MPTIVRRLLPFAMYGFPRPLLRGRSALERLRVHSLRERLRGKPAALRFVLTLVALAGYPFGVANESLRSAGHVRLRNPRVSRWESLRIASLALLRNIPPVEYAAYEFERPEKRADAADYLYWTDTPALLWLNRQRGADNDDVQDKARWARICLEHGLPHVPTLAEFRGGRQVAGVPVDEVAATRLWVKPVNLNTSRGAMGWTRDGDVYRDDRGVTLPREQWIALLARQYCIVQPRLKNHPQIEGITNGAMAAIRLNTVVDRAGRADLIGAILGLPYGTHTTTTGGISGAIDATTGTITRVFQPEVDLSRGHPDTGNPIAGHRMPCWDEIVSLALTAHRTCFPRFASLGWDVVIAPEGPLLLEANSGWGALTQQLVFGPLGKTAFARIVREELELAG